MFLFQGVWGLGGSFGQGVRYFSGFQKPALEAASLDRGGELLPAPNRWQRRDARAVMLGLLKNFVFFFFSA